MLDFNPYTRITAEDALKHRYLGVYHDPSDEPSSSPADLSFEALDSFDEIRAELVKEVRTLSPTSLVESALESTPADAD